MDDGANEDHLQHIVKEVKEDHLQDIYDAPCDEANGVYLIHAHGVDGGLRSLLTLLLDKGLLLGLAGLTKAAEALVEESSEHGCQAKHLQLRDGVAVGGIGDQDGDHLTHVHRGREDQGPELLHLRVDEPLATNCCCAQHPRVSEECWMRCCKAQGTSDLSGEEEGRRRDHGGSHVDVHHLVVLGGGVLLEELLLEGRREAIEEEEGSKKNETMGAVA
mmetsp:Transcript_19783/g.43237  ORF Transcript_19783/g.43237 Transcript_19783/m.43237 type:complete len:218 (-) Transcript_19783:566-1219(-)